MTAYWLSWYQPGADCRPITFPPPESIAAWWKSGETGRYSTLVAIVIAEDAEEAFAAVCDLGAWPDAAHSRFCDEWSGKIGDRFPPSDWMLSRIERARSILADRGAAP